MTQSQGALKLYKCNTHTQSGALETRKREAKEDAGLQRVDQRLIQNCTREARPMISNVYTLWKKTHRQSWKTTMGNPNMRGTYYPIGIMKTDWIWTTSGI